MVAADEIESLVTARYDEYRDIVAGALIGSRAKVCADIASDYDLMILWDMLPACFGDHLYIEEFLIKGIETQAVHFDINWLERLLNYFSDGGDISGDWGDLGLEAFLAFVAEAKLIWGDAHRLARVQNALVYTDIFQEKILSDQLSRLNNSLVQWNKRKGRSNMLAIKSYYDFMDASLRIIYARNRCFYSTIKWFENDINAFPIPFGLKKNLKKMASGQDDFALFCLRTQKLMKAYARK